MTTLLDGHSYGLALVFRLDNVLFRKTAKTHFPFKNPINYCRFSIITIKMFNFVT